MAPSVLTLIILSVTLSAVGQICFKIGLNSSSQAYVALGSLQKLGFALLTPGVMAGLGLYAAGTLLWLSALGRIEVSKAYPFVSVGFALTTLGGWWLFNDQLSVQRILGIGIILLGIAVLAST